MWEHSLASTKQKANLASTKQKATAFPAAILATNKQPFFGHRNFPTVYLPDS
jgi:hypothetical protein